MHNFFYISIHHPFIDVWWSLAGALYSIVAFFLFWAIFTWCCFRKPVLPKKTACHYKREKEKEDHAQLRPFHFHLCSLVVTFSGRLKEKGQFHRCNLLNFTYKIVTSIYTVSTIYILNLKQNRKKKKITLIIVTFSMNTIKQ